MTIYSVYSSWGGSFLLIHRARARPGRIHKGLVRLIRVTAEHADPTATNECPRGFQLAVGTRAQVKCGFCRAVVLLLLLLAVAVAAAAAAAAVAVVVATVAAAVVVFCANREVSSSFFLLFFGTHPCHGWNG